MHSFFLIPLATSLLAGYIFKSCADEMAYLTGSITVVGLILSLVLAPWQIQLLVLMLAIAITSRLLRQSQYPLEFEDNQQQQINAPNVSKELTPTTDDTTKSQVLGKYRGSPWKVSQRIQTPLPQPTSKMKYRGNSITGKTPHLP